ncbi:MarR family winged helix-turn-helix transcriptional regulator [Snuella lapsa]|uniref:HTH marR-type domain-containing protein n=1 Tax=Snuella lapsa TaxID=870481 RepID=A0ABP6YFY3_9FLAO
MDDSIFNPNGKQSTSSKITVGLERISEAFKVLLWEKAKLVGLSPIQIQILIFTAYHQQNLCNVSHLAKEFNVTKPTISDAVRVLLQKELIIKKIASNDSRRYSIVLSGHGHKMVRDTENFAAPLHTQLESIETNDLENLFKTLAKLIYKLNRSGILTVQRTCYGCKFYAHKDNNDFCNLLNKPLKSEEIQLDCPEFKEV